MDADEDIEMRRSLEWEAIERFAKATDWNGHLFWKLGTWTPIQTIKKMIMDLEEYEPGKYPTGFSTDGRI